MIMEVESHHLDTLEQMSRASMIQTLASVRLYWINGVLYHAKLTYTMVKLLPLFVDAKLLVPHPDIVWPKAAGCPHIASSIVP